MAGLQTFNAPNPQGTLSVTPLGSVTLVAGVAFDFTSLIQASLADKIGDVQSVWIDATRASATVVVLNDTTKQYAIWPGGTFGWQSLLIKHPIRFRIRCLADAEIGVCVASGVVPWIVEKGDIIKSPGTSRRVDIAAANADTLLLAENVARVGFSVWNASTDTLFMLLNDSAASSSNYSVQLGPGNYFESPFPYGGEVRGYWSGTNGGARITEFT